MKTKVKIKEEYSATFNKKEVSFILDALHRMINSIGYECEAKQYVKEMYDNLQQGWSKNQ